MKKNLSEFNFRKYTQKYRNQSRGCIRLIKKEFRNINKEEIKIRRKQCCENMKNENLKRMYDIDYRELNREKIQLYKKFFFSK